MVFAMTTPTAAMYRTVGRGSSRACRERSGCCGLDYEQMWTRVRSGAQVAVNAQVTAGGVVRVVVNRIHTPTGVISNKREIEVWRSRFGWSGDGSVLFGQQHGGIAAWTQSAR